MLKKLTLLALFVSLLFAVDIEVKLGKSKDDKYSILNLESSEPFVCYKNEGDGAAKNSFMCEFDAPPKARFSGFESEFFEVGPIGGGKYRLAITAKTKAQIFSQNFDPKKGYEKKAGFERRAKKFVIVAYKKELKFVSPNKKPVINFPVALASDPYVYVKTLDIDGLPIDDTNSLQDIAEFNSVKKMYDKGDYAGARTYAERAQKTYPKSIFFSEYELIRIKSLVAMGGAANNTAAIELGRNWLKNFPADDKAPEALLAIMKGYAHNQDFKNAEYYFERIVGDYPFLEISKQAMIDYGDALRHSKAKRAIELYKRALYETKDLQTASIAAFKAADTYLALKDIENAKEYYGKILKGNMAFVTQDPQMAYAFAKKLAGALIYGQAVEVGEQTLDKLNKKSESYESLLSELGEWASFTGDTIKAKEYFERYLSEYPVGRYAHLVEAKLDKLNFGAKKEMGVDELIELADKYPKEGVGQKALVRAMGSLLNSKRYADVLAMEPKTLGLPKELAAQAQGYIQKSEKELFAQNLAQNRCKEALALLSKKRITTLAGEEPKLFDCYMQTGDISKAYELAKKNMAIKDLKAKLPWLDRLEQAAMRGGRTKEAYEATKDILSLSRLYKERGYERVAFDGATLALEYKDANLMADSIAALESYYPKDPRTITAYKAAIRFAVGKNDALANLRYSQKLYELQKGIKVYVESPWIEFNYASALAKTGDYKKAAGVLESSLVKKMSDSDRARALFEISSNYASAKERQKAKKALEDCVKIKGDSSWKKLCKESIEILK